MISLYSLFSTDSRSVRVVRPLALASSPKFLRPYEWRNFTSICIVVVIYSSIVNACACNILLPTHCKRRPRARTLDSTRHRTCTLDQHVAYLDAIAITYARSDTISTFQTTADVDRRAEIRNRTTIRGSTRTARLFGAGARPTPSSSTAFQPPVLVP